MSHRRLTRDLLVAHAIEVLEETGPAGFSGREVARRAGVSHKALARHFASGGALLGDAAARGFGDLFERIVLAKHRTIGGPEDERLRVALAYLEFARDRPAMFDLMYSNGPAEGSEELDRARDAVFLLMAASCVSSQEGEETPPSGTWAWAGVHGLALLMSRGIIDELSGEDLRDTLRRQLP